MKAINDEGTGYVHLAIHLLLGTTTILLARCVPYLEPF